MSRRNLYWLLGIMCVSLLGFAVSQSAPTRDENYELVRLFVDVLREVDQKYVVELDPERKRKLAEDMINGGLERLDPHSAYINQREYKQFNKQSKGKFGGIGVQVGYDRQNRGQLTVISPMPGTPAYEAGILAGDMILKIDGKTTENMRLNEAVDLIQGDPGQKITLTVLHEGQREARDVDIVRDEIHVQSVLGDKRQEKNLKEWDFLYDKGSKIGYIRLTSFSETATTEIKAALDALQKEGAKGLILDLRNNPGGLLRAAVEISNLFLKEGRIVSTKGRNEKEEIYDARPELTLPYFSDKFPIALLVNKFSASASEIVSAALQDNNRATIIGERSYGKGSVQNIILMEKDTSALKLTTASYWRPSGKNIHRFPDSKETDEWGVKPNKDMEVPMKDEERLDYMLWRSDRDVVGHKNNKDGAAKEEKDKKLEQQPKDKKEKKEFKDRVMEKALEHIKKEIEKARARAVAGCWERVSEQLTVLYEDNHCLAVAKPAPLLTQGVPAGIPTLEAMVKAYLKDRYHKPGNVYLGIPHRLDRPVSGVVLFARNTKAARRLAEQFQERQVRKVYWAIVERDAGGQVPPEEGQWEDHLLKIKDESRTERVTPQTPGARHALLRYRRLREREEGALLEIEPMTGRMHQIRVQTASRGWPVRGDLLYGARLPFGPEVELPRDRIIALHAHSLTFLHPIRFEPITVTAAPPLPWAEWS